MRAWYFDRLLHRFFKQNSFDHIISLGRTSCHDALVVAGNHLGYLEAMGKKPGGLSDRMQIRMDSLAYESPGRMLAASSMVKEQMVRHHQLPPERVEVLYPPTDTVRFHHALKARKAEFRDVLGLPQDKKLVAFVSSNHVLKGLPILLDVMEKWKGEPFELLVAGARPPETNLPNVRYLGFVQETEKLYAAADLTVLPSSYDAFAQVITESLLCGTPAIVSHMTGAAGIIDESKGEGRVVSSFKSEDWANALETGLAGNWKVEANFVDRNHLHLADHMAILLKK